MTIRKWVEGYAQRRRIPILRAPKGVRKDEFTVGCYMNGHSFVAQMLRSRGIVFKKKDNAFLRCDDPKALCRMAASLGEAILRKRADYWAFRLGPSFTRRERRMCVLHYQWSIAQIEFSRNIELCRRPILGNWASQVARR